MKSSIKLCLHDPSNRDLYLRVVHPDEDIHALVQEGSVWLYFYEPTEDADFPNPEKHRWFAGICFMKGHIGDIAGSGSHPTYQRVHRAFQEFKRIALKPSAEQFNEAMDKIYDAIVSEE